MFNPLTTSTLEARNKMKPFQLDYFTFVILLVGIFLPMLLFLI